MQLQTEHFGAKNWFNLMIFLKAIWNFEDNFMEKKEKNGNSGEKLFREISHNNLEIATKSQEILLLETSNLQKEIGGF